MKAKSIVAMIACLAMGVAFAQDEATRWADLSDGQREVLSQFADTWDSLPADRQAHLSMAPDERAAARGRFDAWRELSVERRELIRERAEIFRSLSPDEQRRIRENYRKFRQLNHERRQQLRERYRHMTPEQRKRLRDRLHQRPRPRTRD
jgi:hypothetical protein